MQKQVACTHLFLQEYGSRPPLGMLGIPATTLTGLGTQSTEVAVPIPHQWNITNGATLNLALAASSHIVPYEATLEVRLNERVIQEIPIEPQDMTREQVQIPLATEHLEAFGMMLSKVESLVLKS